jgi:MoaA/NifB/PqqE/SkfB family radical SAM enzyme
MKPKVYSIAIELTAHCNQKCSYCYNEWRDDGGLAMGAPDADLLFARVDKILAQLDVDHFTLTGGEPFAHRGAVALIEHLRARGKPVQIISNGGLIDDVLASRLAPLRMKAAARGGPAPENGDRPCATATFGKAGAVGEAATGGVVYVQITLNGPDAALHEDHVGKGHFAPTIEGVRALRRHGVLVVGCIVVTKKNARRVGDTLETWRSLGVTQIALSRFSPAGYSTSRAWGWRPRWLRRSSRRSWESTARARPCYSWSRTRFRH